MIQKLDLDTKKLSEVWYLMSCLSVCLSVCVCVCAGHSCHESLSHTERHGY